MALSDEAKVLKELLETRLGAATTAAFTDEALESLVRKRYINADLLADADREGLTSALPEQPALVSTLLKKFAGAPVAGGLPAGLADQEAAFRWPPVMYSKTAIVSNWVEEELKNLARCGPVLVDGTVFRTWLEARSSIVHPFVLHILAAGALQMIRCGKEPHAECYKCWGAVMKMLVIACSVLDGYTPEYPRVTKNTRDDMIAYLYSQYQQSPLHQRLEVVCDSEVKCEDWLKLGVRKPDIALMFVAQGVQLASHRYHQLVQLAEFIVSTEQPMEPAVFSSKLAQALDSAARLVRDASFGGRNYSQLQLPMEVSDGVHTVPAIASYVPGAVVRRASYQLVQLTGQQVSLETPVLEDKLYLALAALRQLQPLMQAAGAKPMDTYQPAGTSEVSEGFGILELGPEVLNSWEDTRCSSDTSLPLDQLHAERQRFQVLEVLRKGQEGYGTCTYTLKCIGSGGALDRQTVIMRVGTKLAPYKCNFIFNQQVVREHSAYADLKNSGKPYLSDALTFGVVTGGGDLSGAPAVVTRLCGEPLQQYLAWQRGVVMSQKQLLLLSSCLCAAGLSMMVAGVFHNDMHPRNITVTFNPNNLHEHLYHVVDFGLASTTSLRRDSFKLTWGFPPVLDPATTCYTKDLMFGSLEACRGHSLRPAQLLPLADMQSAVYMLVFLATGTLPWAHAAADQEESAAVSGREQAFAAGRSWVGLASLPAAVADFGGWVLSHAEDRTISAADLRPELYKLFAAVKRELGTTMPWPEGVPT